MALRPGVLPTEQKIADNDTATIEELIDTSLDTGVEFQAYRMTIDRMSYDEDDFYEEVTTGVGAATAIQTMADTDIQLPIRSPVSTASTIPKSAQ